MSPGQKILVYFGLAKPPPGALRDPSVRPDPLRAAVGIVASGIVFGLITWVFGEAHPVLAGILFAVLMGLFTVVREVRRDRRDLPPGAPGPS